MPRDRAAGLKAKAKNLARNPNHYSDMGKLGGKTPKSKPFGFAAMDKDRLREISRLGGSLSRRGRRQ